MEAIKRHQLFSFFLASFIVFNVLFVVREPIVQWWYDRINVYQKCEDLLPENSSSYALQNCDINSITKVNNITTSAFALSGVASAVSGSILLVRLIERTWSKQSKPKTNQRPRRPL